MTSGSLERAQNWPGGTVFRVKAFGGAAARCRAPCGFHVKLRASRRGTTQPQLESVLPGPGMAVRQRTAPSATPTGTRSLCLNRTRPEHLPAQRRSPVG